jgi:regulator of CtrA degradation
LASGQRPGAATGNYVEGFAFGVLDSGPGAGDAVGLCEAYMSEKRLVEAGPVSFSERLASSQIFATLFRDGMALVEETASYLDGAGRLDSKKLERGAALVYATESMRLTTRLMQLASWLLLHRAVKEGEMTLAQASKEKTKVRLAACEPGDAKSIAMLPAKLQELIGRSTKLQADVRRLDTTMHATPAVRIVGGNPVERQWGLLKAAFESDAG